MYRKENCQKIMKPKSICDKNLRNFEEMNIIPPEKKEEISNELRQVLQTWNTIKCLNY